MAWCGEAGSGEVGHGEVRCRCGMARQGRAREEKWVAIERAAVIIEGLSPLLMHRYPLEPVEAIEKMPPKEQAEIAAYRLPTGELFVPGLALQRCLVAAATYSKGKGRASLQKPVAACVLVNPMQLRLGTSDYEVDAQAVVVPATKGRIVRYRPRLDKWRLDFELEWDPLLLTESQVRRIVDDGGTRVGLLDFRPERKGPYGRFVVVNWSR